MQQSTLLAHLPKEPDEQIKLGLRIIEGAYDEKVRALEHETRALRSYGNERQQQVQLLERRVTELEATVQQGEQRMRELTSENNQLANEKAALFQEVRLMQERLGKLDQFKKSILQSIQDEPDLSVVSQRPSGALLGVGSSSSYTGIATGGGAKSLGEPPRVSTSYACGGAGHSAMASPAPKASTPSHYASSPSPLAPAAAADADVPQPDGKEFFRAARLRLTYEQFNSFLTSIKKLNDHAQSREDTLAQAQDIFGDANNDLFVSFRALLTKHGLS